MMNATHWQSNASDGEITVLISRLFEHPARKNKASLFAGKVIQGCSLAEPVVRRCCGGGRRDRAYN